MTHKTCDLCGKSEFIGSYKVPSQSFLGIPKTLFEETHFMEFRTGDLPKHYVIDLCPDCRNKIDAAYQEYFWDELISKCRKESAY